jgi:F-type H+-transporting ATPase subunit delta
MPLTDSPADALANVYARSLFELAEAKGGQATIEGTLGELEEILELARSDARFNEFLASRVLPVAQRSASLEKIFKGRVSELILRFLQILNEKGRLRHLPPILEAFDALVQEKFGRIEVDVYTAAPISPEDLRAIRDQLQKTIRREPIVRPYTDHSMLGGVKLQIGDRLIDGSLATRLRKFREQLATHGTDELRARAESLIDEAGGPI